MAMMGGELKLLLLDALAGSEDSDHQCDNGSLFLRFGVLLTEAGRSHESHPSGAGARPRRLCCHDTGRPRGVSVSSGVKEPGVQARTEALLERLGTWSLGARGTVIRGVHCCCGNLPREPRSVCDHADSPSEGSEHSLEEALLPTHFPDSLEEALWSTPSLPMRRTAGLKGKLRLVFVVEVPLERPAAAVGLVPEVRTPPCLEIL